MASILGSSYWGWNPLHWWTTESPLTEIQTCPLIGNFPPELRIWICSYLNERDRRSMKQVCKHFEIDINHIYGADAILNGQKFWKQLSALDRARIKLFGNTVVTKRIEENANWIRNMITLPQKLVLRRFSGLNIDTRKFVIVPDFIRSLTIELDQRQPEFVLERLKEVLAYYKSLQRLSLTCHAYEPAGIDYVAFNTFATNVAENLFASLEFNPHLSELSASVVCIYSNSIPILTDFDIYFAKMTIPPEVAAKEQWLQTPPQLSRMNINIPYCSMDQLRRWKKLLDAQDRLIHLKLYFGRLHWNFYRTVLRKNASNLKTLDLVFLNWWPEQRATVVSKYWTNLEWFDWNLILPAAKKLKSLRISTDTYLGRLYILLTVFRNTWPNNTLNFHLLVSLTSLQELVLVGIYLNQSQLEIIFRELPRLRDVELTAWTRTGEALLENPPNFTSFWGVFGREDYTKRNQNLCDLLKEVLLKKNLNSIKLVDVSIWVCAELTRQGIFKEVAKSFYSITWLEPPWYSSPRNFYLHPLILKLN